MAVVNDAVILAGGLGSRMLPASLYSPKETLPLVDTPIINHLVWVAAKAGVTRVHLVLSESKGKYLEPFINNSSIFAEDIRPDLPRSSLSLGVDGVEIIPHIQFHAGGVADAISLAIAQIDGPFLVLLGDMLIMDNHLSPRDIRVSNASSASLELVRVYEKNGKPCVGVFPVESKDIRKYGVVKIYDGLISEIIEKPDPEFAPGNYVLCGRYLLPEYTSDIIKRYPLSRYGEMQSIQMLRHFIRETGLVPIKFDGMKMYDSGDPLDWLKSQIDHALLREDTAVELDEWIRSRIK